MFYRFHDHGLQQVFVEAKTLEEARRFLSSKYGRTLTHYGLTDPFGLTEQQIKFWGFATFYFADEVDDPAITDPMYLFHKAAK